MRALEGTTASTFRRNPSYTSGAFYRKKTQKGVLIKRAVTTFELRVISLHTKSFAWGSA